MIIALTWLWQGLALAGLAVLLLRALPHLNAATRHAMWWTALVAVLCIPLVLVAETVCVALLPGFPSPPARDAVQPALLLPAAPDWVGLLCGSAWILAALFGLIRVVRGYCVMRTLRRTSTSFDPVRERHLPLWSVTRARARRPSELRISGSLAGACAVGFRRPLIVVGRTLVERLDDASLDQVVMHEYAHLARYDDWLQLLQALARAVGGLHPAVCWLSRRIDLDREAACDDHVVARTGAARQYASTLLAAAVAAGPRSTPIAIVPSATLRGSALRRRVARLLDPSRATGTRATPVAAIGVVLPVVAILAGPRVAPLIAFVDAVELALPVQRLTGQHPAASTEAIGEVGGMGSTAPARASGPAAPSVSRSPAPLPAARARANERPISHATPESTSVLPAMPPAPMESRRLFDHVDARLLSTPPAATMNGFPVPAPPARESGQAGARPPLAGAKDATLAVAAGAERRSIAIGRAFARAGQAIAGKF